MDLQTVLEQLSYECIQGSVDKKITEVVYDSRKVTEGCLFVCVKGAVSDGHSYAAEVVKKGAGVLVVQDEVDVPQEITVIRVENTRYALACISAAYFGHPARQLKVIGITGTKGKTTTAYMIKNILEQAGHKVGLVGTIGVVIGEELFVTGNTTPESFLLQKYLRKMADEGCDTVVMEVSSQGLMLHRTAGFQFDIGIFMNIEPDHIGPNEHKDFEDYLRCKSLLFQQCRLGIINCDDAHWKDVLKGHTCEIKTFGFSKEADYSAGNVELVKESGTLGVRYRIEGEECMDVTLHVPGKFSVYNSMAAVAACRQFQVSQEEIRKALRQAKVKGRIEMIPVSDEFTLLIDYAHNAMSLESLLTTLREYEPKRLVCMFGCGGNRSKIRRYEMGEVSGRLADLTVITSDNPRDEEPQAIIDDIKIGIEKTAGNYVEIINRKDAIAYVIKNGRPGDIIVLAGKGHENYQEIKGKKYPMDERVMINEIIKSGE